MALDPDGNLLVVYPPIGVWQFDRNNLPKCFFAAPDDAFVTNLVVRRTGETSRMFVTDSINGRVLVADLPGS
jgi:hypothetical protein